MTKKQKVRFHKGDKRPSTLRKSLSYSTKPVKENKEIVWHVIEKPTNNCVAKYEFEEDAQSLADFQNKHRVWQVNGGIPRMFWNYIYRLH